MYRELGAGRDQLMGARHLGEVDFIRSRIGAAILHGTREIAKPLVLSPKASRGARPRRMGGRGRPARVTAPPRSDSL